MPPSAMRASMRSTVFAFKCKMGTPLTRLDFNLVLHSSNAVKQLYFSVENDVHLVCMRLTEAISRIRFANALSEIERKPLTNFKRTNDSLNWTSFIFMGNELREGEGAEIKQTLKYHMETRDPAFFQSHSTNTRHVTHMLRNPLRPNHRNPVIMPAPSAPQMPRTPSTSSDTTIPLDSPAPTLPVAGSPVPAMDRSNSAQMDNGPQVIFSVPQMINGQPNMIDATLRLRDTVSSVLRDLLGINLGFNLQERFGDLTSRMDELMDITTRTRAEIAQMRQGN